MAVSSRARFRRFLLALGLLLCALPHAPGARAQTALVGGDAAIQPGDHIVLRILAEPELSDTFAVAPSGEAVLPWLSATDVTRYTAGSLPAFLRAEYARYLRDPSVDVIVLRRVGVHGEVREPGLYWVDLTMTVRDVIALAGGITEIADPRQVDVLRGAERIRLQPEEGAELSTRELRSGDHLVVGRRSWLSRNVGTVIGGAGTLLGILLTLGQLSR